MCKDQCSLLVWQNLNSAVVQPIGIRCRQHCYHVNIMKLLWKSKTNLLVFVRRNDG
jgi:hypothetical protein